MEDVNFEDLQSELTELEAEEARLSAERGRLHDKIDFGFGTAGTKEREREISDARLDIHRRIDALKERLGLKETV